MSRNNKNRQKKSSSALVGVVAFFLGFLFAFIVLFGSLFGVGYVAATTDINKVFELFGLDNKNAGYDENDPDSNKYNYINADQAPNLYKLITEVINMANDGLGEISIDRISALAPVTDAVLDMGYEFIDGVVDFDKEFFEGVSLTSVLDCVTNSVNYVRTGKIIGTVNSQFGSQIDLSEVPIASYMIDGIEAEYATVEGGGESFRLPVLFDYYVEDGSRIGYGRTVSVNGICAYPDNFGDDTSYLQETSLKNDDGQTLYKVYYVPCKITPTGIEEADYSVKKLVKEDPNVTFTKDGTTYNLKYVFRVVEFGEDTDFIAVKPDGDGGINTFSLNHSEIIAAKNPDPSADASARYTGYSYYEAYARNYYQEPSERSENELIYGVSTINNINFFKDNDGNIIEYDPLLVSDVMIDPMGTLDNVPVYSVVNTSQAETVKGIFGDTSLGAVLSHNVDFNGLVDGILLSTFVDDVSPDDDIMTYLVYNITGVKSADGVNYTAVYDKDGANIAAVVTVEDGVIKKVADAQTGETLDGNTIADVSTMTDGLTLDIFMDVTADDPVMLYLGYGVTGTSKAEGQNYDYVGMYEDEQVYIYANQDGSVNRIETYDGVVLGGTKVNDVSARVDGIMDALTLPEFIDIDPEESVLAYIGYGVYGVEAASGTAYGKNYDYTAKYKYADGSEGTVYISSEIADGKNRIVSVWDGNGSISGTKMDGVSDRINDLQNTLTIGELVEVDENSSMILRAIADATIGGLDDRINELTVKDVLSEEQINNNSVLPQLKDKKITELGTEIDKVLIQRIYCKDIYGLAEEGDPAEAAEFDPAYLYYEKNGETFELTEVNCAGLDGTAYDNALGKLTQEQWENRGDKVYYTYGEAKGMWKLILYRVEGGGKTEKAYTINNFNNMVAASSSTVYNSTLGELQEADIISASTNLDKYLKAGDLYITVNDAGTVMTTAVQSEAKKMSGFTLRQLLDAVVKFMGSDS